MGMPKEFVFVRHGESEANILQQAEKAGTILDLPPELRYRPDWEHRLTEKGVEQAKIAGQWILGNIGDISETFAARYYSTFIRARETAYHLGGPDVTWRKHSMIHERDWGQFGTTPREEQAEAFPHTHRLKKEAPLFARMDGGEALADSVTLRIRDFRATAKRKWDGEKLIAVTHGDTIGVVRYVFEDLLPEEWHKIDKDESQRIDNCSILRYACYDPNDPDHVLEYAGWRQMINPTNSSNSPFDGEWVKLPDNRLQSGAELLESVENFQRFIV